MNAELLVFLNDLGRHEDVELDLLLENEIDLS